MTRLGDYLIAIGCIGLALIIAYMALIKSGMVACLATLCIEMILIGGLTSE